jgi:chromosome segregation ATPase
MEELNFKVAQLDQKLKMDHQRMKVIHLKKQIKELESKKDDLEIQCNEANMPIPELRERLLQKMKEDRSKIQETEARTRELRRAVNQMRARLRDLEDEIGGNTQITEENKQKYEAIYKKEQEIDKFMKNFQKYREKELNEIENKQQEILRYMESISHAINLMKRAPSGQDYERIRETLSMQNRQTKDAQATLRLVQSQLSNRKNDLDKLENLEQTLPDKLKKLKEQKEHMKKELVKFKNVDEVVDQMNERREKLARRTNEMMNMSDSLRDELKQIQREFKNKKKELTSHQAHGSFSELSRKIGQNEQLINHMQNFIAARSEDMNLGPILEKCSKLATEINKHNCKF